MYKKVLIAGAAVLMLAGCQTDSQSDRALGGAGLGAATGAVIGGVTTGTGGGAAVGAVAGGAAGAMIGAATTPKNCWARDAYGNPYRVACP